jgi:hypothetical protein
MAFLVLIFTELVITQYFPASIFCTENYKTRKKDVDSRPKKLLPPPPPQANYGFHRTGIYETHNDRIHFFSYPKLVFLTMPISVQGRIQEWNRILTMARNNGFPTQLLHGMKKQRIAKKEGTQTRADQQHSRK